MMEPTQSDAAKAGATDSEWPPELDALVAAPAHHRLLFENEKVRVLETTIAHGDRTPVHTHRWPSALYVLSWSPFVRFDTDESVLLDSREVPALATQQPVVWSAPLPPHAVENVGEVDFHVINVEVKGVVR